MENGRCRIHGGTTPKGVASPHYKDGRQSRYRLAPGTRTDLYVTHLGDLDYLAMRDEVALVSTMLQELIDEEQGPTPPDECVRCASIGRQQRITDLVEVRRKLADTEARRIKLAKDTLSEEQVRAFGQALLEAGRRTAAEFLPRDEVGPFLSAFQERVRTIVETANPRGA